MSISTVTYANRLMVKNIYNESVPGSIGYNNDGAFSHVYDTRNVVPLSLAASADYQTKVLFTYADGKKIRLHHHIYAGDDHDYIMKYYFDLVDANDTIVEISNVVAHNNPTNEGTAIEYWDPTQPGFDVFPFSECYYVPTHVDYYVNQMVTVVNDPAQRVQPCGRFYWKHSRPPIGGYVELTGLRTVGEIGDSYGSSDIICMITADEAYAAYFGSVDPGNIWHEAGDTPPSPDPSGPGGGDTPSDDGGDAVDFPSLPSISVINTGLVTIFNPSDTQLRSLAGVLWGNDFETSIKKVLNDPFDGLISLLMIPFSPTTSGSVNCEIGNFDTQVQMPIVSAQYYTLDCGTLQVKENWKNALDYNATSAEIFLPFVGFRPLDIQDVMNRTLSLKYMVDVLTGSAIAILKCGDKCLYEFPCNLGYSVPLTGSNRAALYTGLINVAMSGLGGLAVGGAMGAVGGAATSAINVATHAQSNVQRSGSLASNTGVLGEFTPYLVLHRPKQSLAENFKAFKGYQSNITMYLGTCEGYTEVEFIHLTGINGATDTELEEIESLLKRGVII